MSSSPASQSPHLLEEVGVGGQRGPSQLPQSSPQWPGQSSVFSRCACFIGKHVLKPLFQKTGHIRIAAVPLLKSRCYLPTLGGACAALRLR